MEKILKTIDLINAKVGLVAAYFTPALILIMSFEVIMRYAFNRPTIWVYESTMFLLGISAMMGGGFAILNNLNVRIDILYARCSPKKQATLNLITSVFTFAFVLTLLVYGGQWAWSLVLTGDRSESLWGPPLYPVKMFVPIGAFLMFLQLIAAFARDLQKVLKTEEI